MRYTSYLKECVSTLEREGEYETDIILVFLLRIQHLTQRISELNPRDNTIEEFNSIPKAPTAVYVSAFQNELNELRAKLPDHLKNDSMKYPNSLQYFLGPSNPLQISS